jgi:hypothetical protein
VEGGGGQKMSKSYSKKNSLYPTKAQTVLKNDAFSLRPLQPTENKIKWVRKKNPKEKL